MKEILVAIRKIPLRIAKIGCAVSPAWLISADDKPHRINILTKISKKAVSLKFETAYSIRGGHGHEE